MTDKETTDIFFSRAFEDVINEKVLDDKAYVVPVTRIQGFVRRILNTPYQCFLDFLKYAEIPLPHTGDITQFSSIGACTIEMCKNLIDENNPGFTFDDIGTLFPQYCKGKTPASLKKYGENHIKTARQLGLAFEYYGLWYLSTFGYVYPSLSEEERSSLLARTILRDPLYGRMIHNMMTADIELVNYMNGLSAKTIVRRAGNIRRILKFAADESAREGIALHECRYTAPKI